MCTPLQKSFFSKPSVLTLLSHASDLHWSQGDFVPVLSIRTVSVPLPNPTTMNEPRSEQQEQLHRGFYQSFNNTKWQIWARTWKKRSAAGFLCEHRELCPVSTEAQLSGFSGVWRLFPNLRVQHILSIWHNDFSVATKEACENRTSRPILSTTSCCFLPTVLYQALHHHKTKEQ